MLVEELIIANFWFVWGIDLHYRNDIEILNY